MVEFIVLSKKKLKIQFKLQKVIKITKNQEFFTFKTSFKC